MKPNPPRYQLTRPETKQFVPPGRARQSTSPSSSSPKTSRLFQRSSLQAAPVQYSRKRRRELSDDESENEEVKETSRAPEKPPEPAFVLPPNIDIPNLNLFKKPALKPATRSKAFQSPDETKVAANLSPPRKHFKDPLELSIPIFTPESPSTRTCIFCRKKLPATFTEPPPSGARARYSYCQRHENASHLEYGKSEGFPETFDFTSIRSRILALVPAIQKVLSGSSESEFLASLRKTTRRNVATPMTLITVLDDTQPGYYGPRGAEMISEIMMNEFGDFIRHRKGLYDALKFCGGVMGYVSSVLVPEVGVRLIMEDMRVDWNKAKEIMKASVAYGNVVNTKTEVISSDDEDEDEDQGEEPPDLDS